MQSDKTDRPTDGGWRGTWRRLRRGGPILGAPDIARLFFSAATIAVSASFVGPPGGCAMGAAFVLGGLICWRADRRARFVEWIQEWAMKHD